MPSTFKSSASLPTLVYVCNDCHKAIKVDDLSTRVEQENYDTLEEVEEDLERMLAFAEMLTGPVRKSRSEGYFECFVCDEDCLGTRHEYGLDD